MHLKVAAKALITIVISSSCKASVNYSEPQNLSPAISSAQSAQQIRTVDFKNFTYPVCPNIGRNVLPGTKSISLTNGGLEVSEGDFGNEEPIDFSLSNVAYYDLTGDGKEEAIVTLTEFLFPQGSSNCTFIYAWEEATPHMIQQYEFGSGARGGLRRISVTDSELIIEQYESDRLTAYCCPEKFIRSSYKWDGKQFQLLKKESLKNESKHDDFLGYP